MLNHGVGGRISQTVRSAFEWAFRRCASAGRVFYENNPVEISAIPLERNISLQRIVTSEHRGLRH